MTQNVSKLIIEIPRPDGAENGWYQDIAKAMFAGGRIYGDAKQLLLSPTLRVEFEADQPSEPE